MTLMQIRILLSLITLLELDKWVLHELAHLQEDVIGLYTAHIHITKLFREYIISASINWAAFILDIIKDRQYTTQQDSEIRRSAQTAMQLIVNQLVVLISPVLSFTAEEIWQGNDFLLAESDSVFLTTSKRFRKF